MGLSHKYLLGKGEILISWVLILALGFESHKITHIEME